MWSLIDTTSTTSIQAEICYTHLVLVWSLIDTTSTTSTTSIQAEICNQFSCCSFKTNIFQSEENGGTFGDFWSLLYLIKYTITLKWIIMF